MELEGFGASLAGSTVWSISGRIPWEFLTGVNYTIRILIVATQDDLATPATLEGDWTIVWRPRQPKDWSYIATVLRGMPNTCLLAFTGFSTIPASFQAFVDSLVHEHHFTVSRIWLGRESPPWIPDAVFMAPFGVQEHTEQVFKMLQQLPGKPGVHGPWNSMNLETWVTIVAATREQGLGLVLSDAGEHAWTLMWHRPADSAMPLERRTATGARWLTAVSALLS